MIDIETFLKLPTEEVAQLVREAGPKVCVFPINGTRRWFMLEYPEQAATDFMEAYLRITWQRQIELYRLIFDHGIDTLLTPIFGPDLLERGEEYSQLLEPGLLWFTQDRDLLNFYDAYDVRVRVYGDTRRYFRNTPYAHTLEAFDELTQRTVHHNRFRLFFGVCAHDPTETVAEIGVRFYQEQGHLPDRRQIVEAYYGEYVEPVDFFIGFDRPAAFDMPLIATGNEDLYFTVSPSPYLDARTLRAILYDHLYARRVDETDYAALLPEDWQTLADFYALNRHHVLGLGRKHRSGNFWHPLPQVQLLHRETKPRRQ
ncbi:MAG: diterpene synthase [Chloroflexota bacterium]|nr:diterpene synthase [Chloroflexota bacterium]